VSIEEPGPPYGKWEPTAANMSLRDYFAAQALAGVFTSVTVDDDPPAVAALCYRYADAMLAARDKEAK
jgi:hypothetical protein